VLGENQSGAPTQNSQKKEKKSSFKNYFTATRITYIAIFTALSYVLYLFDFSLLPSTPVSFLKLDFSNVFVMISGFALGPVAGIIVGVLKELIHALTVGNTAFVGELANILFIMPYMLIPAIVYRKHKGIKTVIITLALGCVAACLVSLPVNYLLTFPAFMAAYVGSWESGHQLFISVWYWALLFNLIKTVLVSVAVMLLYKPLSSLIKATNKKFESTKNRPKKSKKTKENA
jgi:riboflavin transporter FmnP